MVCLYLVALCLWKDVCQYLASPLPEREEKFLPCICLFLEVPRLHWMMNCLPQRMKTHPQSHPHFPTPHTQQSLRFLHSLFLHKKTTQNVLGPAFLLSGCVHEPPYQPTGGSGDGFSAVSCWRKQPGILSTCRVGVWCVSLHADEGGRHQ